MRTSSFVCTVCRFADGGDMSPPYNRGTHPRRRARPLGAPVQELPSAYKPAPRTHGRLIAAPTRRIGGYAVGADSIRPRAGNTECVQTHSRRLHPQYPQYPQYPQGARRIRNAPSSRTAALTTRRAGAGTTKCVQTRSSVPSAASRTARPVVVPYDRELHPTVGRAPARGMPHP